MTAELIAILAVGAALGGVLLTGLRGVRTDMGTLRTELRGDMDTLRADVRGDMDTLRPRPAKWSPTTTRCAPMYAETWTLCAAK